MPFAKPTNEAAIRRVLSAPRSSTYVAATGGDTTKAVDLYGWNARISAALMLPSHFAEVSTRNAVSDALSTVYGPQWPWDNTFEQSLPSPNGRPFNPQRDLRETRRREPTTGKVIAELKFAFWQGMFTARHDVRIWNHQILTLFPNASGMTAEQLRRRIYDDLEAIRKLRNRIAHHEPIFSRNLGDDLMRILELIELRSTPTADWVFAMEEASNVLGERP
ncbi:hypothetical protein ACFWAY_25155 [Rhodococcus sp. NPDC059968]|uniref:hypothetical protein n=1 Tax=Rhodococcus sp. NPDC059968 TaxID=3347017 RepID=UPI00367091CE